ncbi:uncharacterized protein LOC123684794 isoform X2 [Harmonia axyridis]|uniref:uncharacterized protein LOC123684794 isoform X2 n=1 Tax=Harmonia axyridis TaxID=115357 RepID=UPI001E2754D5|nr:uncharacterized protein LOC123684794 isoform X2 [Harmonia axyridis]
MCSALKILVCVATVLALSEASSERQKRSDYGTLNESPWRSPTSYGFRPNNNYYNIPTTRITRVYNPYQNGRNNQRAPLTRNVAQDQSGWVPISPNSNQQNGYRYAQQRPRDYSRANAYNTIRYSSPVDVEGLLNGRTGQRQPNYSVLATRGNQVDQQTLRAIDGKVLIQSTQVPARNQIYRNLNQGSRYQGYQRQPVVALNNRGIGAQNGNIHLTRVNPLPVAVGGRFLGQQENQGRNLNQPIDGIDQQTLEHLIRSNEQLPAIEGRFLGVVEQERPVEEQRLTNDASNQDNLRVINAGHLLAVNQIPVVQGQIQGGNVQRPSGYAVQENAEPENQLNQQELRSHLIAANQLRSNIQGGISTADNQQQTVEDIYQPDEELKQILRVVTPTNLVRPSEPQNVQQYLRNNVQQNNPTVGYGIGVGAPITGESSAQNLALVNSKPLYGADQLSAVQGQILGNPVRQQYIQNYLGSLDQRRPQLLKVINADSEQEIRSNQLQADQLRLIDELRNNQGSDVGASNVEGDASQGQQQGVDDGSNQNVYSYAELTARIWKVIKSNPDMMANLENLRQLLLDDRNSRNQQIMELRGLLEEARKYAAIYRRNQAGQTLEQQKRSRFVSDLIDTMNKNEQTVNQRRQLPYGVNNRDTQGRFIVRPADVNPLLKKFLLPTAVRNETQTITTSSDRPTPIIVRPSNNVPLPQLEVAEPFGFDQLEHHYDLSQWKKITESLRGNPFLEQYNILEHLV